MSKFANKNKPKLKTNHVAVLLDDDELERLEEITFNKSGWCREAVLKAMDKHDCDRQG